MRTHDEVISLARLIPEFAPRTIHISYKLFLDIFSGPLDDAKVLTGAYMVYGWMPTMLRLKGPKEVLLETAILGRSGMIDIVSLLKCAKTLNNSLVGTTKLLHFVAPEKYSIWDTRVYRALYNKSPHAYRVENPSCYMDYLQWGSEFENILGYSTLKERFEAEAGYPVSNKRVTEAILYALGSRIKKVRVKVDKLSN